MSHFLGRLASGVTRTAAEPRLRPLQGSIYAPAQPRIGAEIGTSPEWTATESAASETMNRAARSEETHGVAFPARPTAFRAEFDGEEKMQPNPEQRTRTESPVRTAAPRQEILLPPERAETTDRRDAFAAMHAGNEKGNTGRGENFPEAERPLMRRTQIEAASIAPLRAPQVNRQPFAGPAQRTAGESRRAAEPAREPDEISIHIGRVEVAAVTQPVARPATAAPPRKSINLSEYLRRGSGRAR